MNQAGIMIKILRILDNLDTCNNFDIDATLILKDKQGDIANPMNTEITLSLTDGGESFESLKTYSRI